MRDYKAILTTIKTALKDNLPARLVTAGADPIDTFLSSPPNNEKKRQVCVYLDTGDDDRSEQVDGYIIQVALPDKREPSDYLGPVLMSVIQDIEPSDIDYLALDSFKWDVLYSGKPPRGGMGCFIYINVGYRQSIDDCMEG